MLRRLALAGTPPTRRFCTNSITKKPSSLNPESLRQSLAQKINCNYIIHFGNAWAVVALGMQEMLHLRACMVMASTCGVAFNLLQPKPLWAPAGWAVFFIGTISPTLTLTLPSLYPHPNSRSRRPDFHPPQRKETDRDGRGGPCSL